MGLRSSGLCLPGAAGIPDTTTTKTTMAMTAAVVPAMMLGKKCKQHILFASLSIGEEDTRTQH